MPYPCFAPRVADAARGRRRVLVRRHITGWRSGYRVPQSIEDPWTQRGRCASCLMCQKADSRPACRRRIRMEGKRFGDTSRRRRLTVALPCPRTSAMRCRDLAAMEHMQPRVELALVTTDASECDLTDAERGERAWPCRNAGGYDEDLALGTGSPRRARSHTRGYTCRRSAYGPNENSQPTSRLDQTRISSRLLDPAGRMPATSRVCHLLVFNSWSQTSRNCCPATSMASAPLWCAEPPCPSVPVHSGQSIV